MAVLALLSCPCAVAWAQTRAAAELRARLEERENALARYACTVVELLVCCVLEMWRLAEGVDVVGELIADPFASPPRQRTVRLECCVSRPEGWAAFECRRPLDDATGGNLSVADVWASGKPRWECRGPGVQIQGSVDNTPHDPFMVPRRLDLAHLLPSPQYTDPPVGTAHLLQQSLVHSVVPGTDWTGIGPEGVEVRLPTVTVECSTLGEPVTRRRLTYLAGPDPVLVGEERNAPVHKRRKRADTIVTRIARVADRLYASESVATERYLDHDGREVLLRGATMARFRLRSDHPLLSAPWPILAFDGDAGLIRGPDCATIFPSELEEDLPAVLGFRSPIEPGVIR